MRLSKLVVLTTLIFSGEAALAYASDLYGHGIWPGAQHCGYGPAASGVHYDKDFEYRELNDEIKELQRDLKDKSRELSDIKRDLRDYKRDMESYLKPPAARQVISHIENQLNREDYTAGRDNNPSPACSQHNPQGVDRMFCKNEDACDPNSPVDPTELGCVADNKRDLWTNDYISYNSGEVAEGICSDHPAKPGVNQNLCKKKLRDFMNDQRRFDQLTGEVDMIKDRIKELKRDLSRRKRDIKREIEDGTFVESEDTEAEDCPNCSWVQRHSDTIRLVAGIGLPILGAYLGYQGAKGISEQNARLGWPTSPYMASGLAYPFIMQGLYGGVMGGMAAGGLGCVGGYYGGAMGPYGMMGAGGLFGTGLYGGVGGAFGYPPYLYGAGPWGAGPYMPGMGPWGIPGPYINGGFPMGGMMIGGVIGGAIGMAVGGFPYGGGYPIAGYPVGMAMGGAIGGAMAMGGYPMGMAMGGAIGGAMAMGGAIGGAMAMGGYPMGMAMGGAIGGAMGYPLAGYPMGGAMGMVMGGYPIGAAIGGAMGYPMGMAMGGAMGMAMGGVIGTPPFNTVMGGYPMGMALGGAMGAAMGTALGGIQMQQQWMNQYMQMMQQQMQVQQEYMQRQQVIGRLTQELFKIQMQIQQISSGPLYGGSMPYSVNPSYGVPPGGGISGGTATTPNSNNSGSPIRSR